MAFEAEDGSGKSNANSLTSVEYADEYHGDRPTGAAWGAMQVAEKQMRLVAATDYVVDIVGDAWAVKPASLTQSLPFPWLGSMFVPNKVQDAVAELALMSKSTPLLTVVKRGKKSVKLGPLQVQYDGESAVQAKFPSAIMKLAPFIAGYGQSPVNAKLVRC